MSDTPLVSVEKSGEAITETQATIIDDAPDSTAHEPTGSADTGTRTEDGSSAEDAVSTDPPSDTDASPHDAGPNADAASTSVASTTDAGPADTSTPRDDAAEHDPGQPYLFVDLYSGDDGRLVGKQPAWQVLANTKGFVGAILKA